jgi:hypothetical protein
MASPGHDYASRSIPLIPADASLTRPRRMRQQRVLRVLVENRGWTSAHNVCVSAIELSFYPIEGARLASNGHLTPRRNHDHTAQF